MNYYDSCDLLALNKENICEELKSFIQPNVEKLTALYSQPNCGGIRGGRRVAAIYNLNMIHELPEYEQLSEEAKHQHSDHCERMYVKNTLEDLSHEQY